jgi:CelD/BcsL family acetyltransferase involved in cellulose biosynthesis
MVEKKERQEIRRKLRRAEGGDETVAWRIVDGAAYDDAEGQAFMAMMALDPGKARFLTPAMRAQFQDTLRAAAAGGWLHLSWLEVGGQRAAGYLSFDDGRRLYVYNSAIDPRFNALSAGWVLLAYLLQWAITHGRAAFDFMRGGEDYKLRFGGVAGVIYRLQTGPGVAAADLGGEPLPETNPLEAAGFPPESHA